jgi:hypothetical protein
MIKVIPQLADKVKLEQLPNYATNDRYFFEQKIDGHRKMVIVDNGSVQVIGRDGQNTDLAVREAFTGFPGVWVFDGEVLPDGVFWLFDLPVAGDKIGLQTPYRLRRAVLDGLKDALESDYVKILPCARTTEEKVLLAKRVIQSGAEGVMIKDAEASYASGKRTAANLKAKLVKDLDAFITDFGIGKSSDGSGNPKANCELAVFTKPNPLKGPFTAQQVAELKRSGDLKVISECIIHPKERNIVDLGSVVTVAYLYAVDPKKPRLVQPTRLRPRTDKAAGECLLDQVMFTDKSVLV